MYSCSEEDKVWFSQQEQEQAAQEIQDTIKMMDQGIRLDKSKFTSRGLEGLDRLEQRLKQRRQAIGAVIEEQYRQWEEDGMIDDHQISSVYREQTRYSEIEAQALAARDHQEVQSMNLEDGKVHTRANSMENKHHPGRGHPKRSPPSANPLPPPTKPLHFGSLAA